MKLGHFLFLFVWSWQSLAQDYHINYEHLTTQQGLSNNFINDIIQDKFGLIWIATEDGLNRYDGYNFQVFKVNSHDNLPDNQIYDLAEDPKGNIWIATHAGLAKWDIKTGQIQNLSYFKKKPIDYVYIDKKRVWVASNNTVYCIDENKKILKTILNDFPETKVNKIWKQKVHGKEELLISTGRIEKFNIHQVFCFDKQQKKWVLLLESEARIIHISSTGICFSFPIYRNEEKKIEVKGYNDEYTFKKLSFPKNIRNNNANLHNTSAGIDWLGNHDGSIIAVNWQKEEIVDVYKQKLFFLRKRFTDNYGTIWLTTTGAGIFILSKYQNNYLKYYEPNQNKLSGSSVRAIYQDEEKNVWISTYNDEKVLDIFSKDGTQQTLDIKGISFKIIPEKDKNILWIASDKSLLKVDVKTQSILKRYEPIGDYIRDMFLTKNGKIYLVTHSFLGVFDTKTEAIQKHTHIKGSTCILQNKNGEIWIGSKDKGLGLLHTKTMKVKYFSYKPNNLKSISSNHIKSLYEDTKGCFWVSTTAGLNLFDKKSKSFERFTTKDGLANDMIYTTLEDENGYLWLSTNKGISKFNPQTRKFSNYGEEYGLQNNEFNTNAFFKNERTGELFFGGIKGVNSFFPKDMKRNHLKPKVVLTDFKQKGKSIKFDKPLPLVQKIKIAYHEAQVLTFEFTALNFFQSKRNHYAYKIKEIHEDWINLDTKHEFTLMNLNPGTYTLQIKACNNHGIWNEEGLHVTLIVTPPFWQTWWFMAVLLLLMVVVIYGIYRWRVYQILRREKYLENEVNVRTNEIKSQAKALEAQAQELEKLNQTKDHFFAIIAHDLRNPITAFESIASQVNFYLEKQRPEKIKLLVEDISNSSHSLSNLLNNLLNWALIQKKILEPRPTLVLLRPIIDEVIEIYQNTIKSQDIRIVSEGNANLELYIDEDNLKTILRNLVSNALKFTPKQGKVMIATYIKEHKIIITVEDNGVGMSPEKLDKVLVLGGIEKQKDLYGQKGTGLGLILVAEFVKINQGNIQIKSAVDKGTKVIISFPSK